MAFPRFWRENRASGFLLIAVLALLWEGSVREGLVRAQSWPTLSSILGVFLDPRAGVELFSALGHSALRLLLGFAIGGLFGLTTGIMMGLSWRLHATLELTLELLRVIPIPALIPPAILFLGLEDGMKVTIVALSAFWPALLNATYGVRQVDEALVETARTFRTNPSLGVLLWLIPAA